MIADFKRLVTDRKGQKWNFWEAETDRHVHLIIKWDI